MKTTGITFAQSVKQYDRLRKEDILRRPAVGMKHVDYFLHLKTETPKVKKQSFWGNFFAAATFGLTGLYIAHRNNLFNPVKRQVKKIVNSEGFKEKVKTFVYGKLNQDTYENITMRVLREMSKDKADFALDKASEAVTTYSSDKRFFKLFEEVGKVLSDDKNEVSRKNGFVVDVIDKLAIDFEKTLNRRKAHNQSIHDQAEALIREALPDVDNVNSKASKAFIEVISTRIRNAVENFIKSAVSDAKFGNVQQ